MFKPEKMTTNETVLRRAEVADIPKILDLLTKNLAKNLSEKEREEGCLFFEPTQEDMEKIINDTGIYISMKGDQLKGYFMTMSKELAQTFPFELEFIENAENLIFNGKKIKEYRYALLAQICIAKEFRFGMTFNRLHFFTNSLLKDLGFEIGIGEIADINKRSMSSHSGDCLEVGAYTASSGMKWHVMVRDYTQE